MINFWEFDHVYSLSFLLNFRPCSDKPGLCSHPTATVAMVDPTLGSILVRGQKYRVLLDLEMPESPANQNNGKFNQFGISEWFWWYYILRHPSLSELTPYLV